MSAVDWLLKRTYWPVCRLYVRHLGGEPADAFLRGLCSLQFKRVHGFWPNFVQPTRFSEKLWHRMLHDRATRLTLVSDKFRVREYVANRVGEKYLIPLLWHGRNVEGIPYDTLPVKFVIKANHGCGYNIIVTNKHSLNRRETAATLTRWLNENFCQDKYLGIAWGYKDITPEILIEEFLEQDGKPPIDYKFYCFGGRVEVCSLHFDRFTGHRTVTVGRSFETLDFGSDSLPSDSEWLRPSNYQEMVSVAENLADGFDFVRVDLYSIGERVFFGEITPYPAGVSSFHALDLKKVDLLFGDRWQMVG